MTEYQVTERTTLHRRKNKGHYDKETVHSIIDEALICHIGCDTPLGVKVMPTAIWRIGETVYVHGAKKNGLFQSLLQQDCACICVTHLDGLVLARSSFHHSFNYRSVMIYAKARLVEDMKEKNASFDAFMRKITPDRFDQIRGPNEAETNATTLLAFELNEVSAKIRTGPPIDDKKDYELDVWAGVIPLSITKGEPIEDTTDHS